MLYAITDLLLKVTYTKKYLATMLYVIPDTLLKVMLHSKKNLATVL